MKYPYELEYNLHFEKKYHVVSENTHYIIASKTNRALFLLNQPYCMDLIASFKVISSEIHQAIVNGYDHIEQYLATVQQQKFTY